MSLVLRVDFRTRMNHFIDRMRVIRYSLFSISSIMRINF